MSKPYNKNLAKSIKVLLGEIGDNSQREGLLKTPERVAKSMAFLTDGYKKDPTKIIKSAMFAEEYSQMVLVKDIELPEDVEMVTADDIAAVSVQEPKKEEEVVEEILEEGEEGEEQSEESGDGGDEDKPSSDSQEDKPSDTDEKPTEETKE